ncbi:MAG: hypothetical protein D6784_17200 [Chloroflexi bacterium]|nr:MAG: hypothetical protein D6784_17200 [Chloroflexota bacterium]
MFFGVLIGLLLGCIVGAGLVGVYIRQNPPVYAGGAYPKELTQNYQQHYLAMTIDSYLVNRQVDVVRERLKTFDTVTKVRALGRWSAVYMASGRIDAAQAINDLAVQLKNAEGWTPEEISTAVSQLAIEFEADQAKYQGLTTFAGALDLVASETPAAEQPAQAEQPVQAPPAAQAEPGGRGWLSTILLCLLVLVLLALIGFILYRRLGGKKKPARPQVVWEGEGPPPVRTWTGTYTSDRATFDESFTVETEGGAFVGEVGMSISESVPAKTADGKIQAFDVWLFDKTDITTYTTLLLTPTAYTDPRIERSVSANPQLNAVLAEPGTEFTVEGAAIRVEGKVKEAVVGGNDEWFDRLVVHLDVFIKEGADLKIGTMDIPDEYKV